MVVWLLKWRQMVWVTLLVSLLWSSGLMCSTREGEERLAGWWRTEEMGRGNGHLQVRVSKRQVRVPAWLEQGMAWGEIGAWVGVSLSLSWQVGLGGSNATQIIVLIIASHQVRNKVLHLREVRYREEAMAVWQNMVMSELQATMAQARVVLPDEEKELRAKEGLCCEKSGRQTGQQSPALEMGQSLANLVEDLPIGTNLGMLHFLWALVSGNLLESRGAIFPALQRMGLDEAESRRAWAAFAQGKWEISELLSQWQRQVEQEGVWAEHCFAGYRVKAVDLVGFWRPTLQNCPSKHYKAEAGKALPAVVLGMVTRVGQMGEQRLPLPTDFIRVDLDDPSEATLTTKLLKHVAETLAKDELAVLDAGFSLKELLAVGVQRFLLRLPTNATARRNYTPEYKGNGRPSEWGKWFVPYPGRTMERPSKPRPQTARPNGRLKTRKRGT